MIPAPSAQIANPIAARSFTADDLDLDPMGPLFKNIPNSSDEAYPPNETGTPAAWHWFGRLPAPT
eukprot:4028179-Pyramimonas_sp.AAC.1